MLKVEELAIDSGALGRKTASTLGKPGGTGGLWMGEGKINRLLLPQPTAKTLAYSFYDALPYLIQVLYFSTSRFSLPYTLPRHQPLLSRSPLSLDYTSEVGYLSMRIPGLHIFTQIHHNKLYVGLGTYSR